MEARQVLALGEDWTEHPPGPAHSYFISHIQLNTTKTNAYHMTGETQYLTLPIVTVQKVVHHASAARVSMEQKNVNQQKMRTNTSPNAVWVHC